MLLLDSPPRPRGQVARLAALLRLVFQPPKGFARSTEGRMFFGFCATLAILSLGLAFLWYRASLESFRRDKLEENRTAVELVDAAIEIYASRSDQPHAGDLQHAGGPPIPRSFGVDVVNRFNQSRAAGDQLQMQLLGLPGREIGQIRADADAAASLSRLARESPPETRDYFMTGRDGQPMLRGVFPQLASSQTCVDCHNQLQSDGPAWHLNDVMGALVLDVPAAAALADFRLRAVAIGLLAFFGCAFSAFQALMLAHRRSARELEQRSYARLAEAVASLKDHFSLYGPDGQLILASPGGKADAPKTVQRTETEDGRWLQVHESITASGNRVRIESDVTDLKRTEAELRRAMEEAEKANRAKSTFLAMMSHELRTPLNAVIGFSEIMRTQMLGPISARYHEYAEDIHESGLHLLEVINAILDMSKLEAGQVGLTESLCNLPTIVVRCERLVSERAGAADIRIESRFPPDLPEIWADEVKLRQILLNLLSNAVKFTRTGGTVTVTIRDLGPDEIGGGILLSIADTGIGIAAEDLPAALAPFRQLDNKLDRKYEGTGLGLPLAKGLVELHGGAFRIESEVDVGTTVSIHLPPSRRREMTSAA